MMDKLKLFFKGYCMGIAHLIPGVSGGTIALMFGIYEELIGAIKSFDARFVRRVCRLDWRAAFADVAWVFVGVVMLGMLAAVFSLAKVIKWTLIHQPVLLSAFFFGLILATVPIVGRNIRKWSIGLGVAVVLSALAMFLLVGLMPIQTPEALWFLFLSGALSICAMILPGISGAFILVLLGKYRYVIEALSDQAFVPLAAVGLGCLVGILSFVRLLSWLLRRYHDLTVAVLTGLVLGSLRKIWPWKETLQTITTPKGKVIPVQQINVLPDSLTPEVLWAVGLAAFGIVLAYVLGGERHKTRMSRG
jgi:putative membrane protein